MIQFEFFEYFAIVAKNKDNKVFEYNGFSPHFLSDKSNRFLFWNFIIETAE